MEHLLYSKGLYWVLGSDKDEADNDPCRELPAWTETGKPGIVLPLVLRSEKVVMGPTDS